MTTEETLRQFSNAIFESISRYRNMLALDKNLKTKRYFEMNNKLTDLLLTILEYDNQILNLNPEYRDEENDY